MFGGEELHEIQEPIEPRNRIYLKRDGLYKPFDLVKRAVTQDSSPQVLIYAIPGFDINDPNFYRKTSKGQTVHDFEAIEEYAKPFLMTGDYNFGRIRRSPHVDFSSEIAHHTEITFIDPIGCFEMSKYLEVSDERTDDDPAYKMINSALNEFLSIEGRNKPFAFLRFGRLETSGLMTEGQLRELFNKVFHLDTINNASLRSVIRDEFHISTSIRLFKADHPFYEWYKAQTGRYSWSQQTWLEYYDWLDEMGLEKPPMPKTFRS